MAEPITIALSVHQQARLREFDESIKSLQAQKAAAVTMAVSAEYDPSQFAAWSVRLTADALICTPPADASPAPPVE